MKIRNLLGTTALAASLGMGAVTTAQAWSLEEAAAPFAVTTVDVVFLQHALPKGEMRYRDVRGEPSAITQTPILTVEGEKDDITGLGQTEAAHRLVPNLPAKLRDHHSQDIVCHYGLFYGSSDPTERGAEDSELFLAGQ